MGGVPVDGGGPRGVGACWRVGRGELDDDGTAYEASRSRRGEGGREERGGPRADDAGARGELERCRWVGEGCWSLYPLDHARRGGSEEEEEERRGRRARRSRIGSRPSRLRQQRDAHVRTAPPHRARFLLRQLAQLGSIARLLLRLSTLSLCACRRPSAVDLPRSSNLPDSSTSSRLAGYALSGSRPRERRLPSVAQVAAELEACREQAAAAQSAARASRASSAP